MMYQSIFKQLLLQLHAWERWHGVWELNVNARGSIALQIQVGLSFVHRVCTSTHICAVQRVWWTTDSLCMQSTYVSLYTLNIQI